MPRTSRSRASSTTTRIERVYLAFARGAPAQDAGFIDAPIGRHTRDRKRMAIAETGRAARTRWRVVRRFARSGVVKLELRPETGRTHQLRVHLASRGLPLVGDVVYGEKRAHSALGRPALHAAVLGFAHPTSGATLRFEAPLPADLAALEASLARGEPGHG